MRLFRRVLLCGLVLGAAPASAGSLTSQVPANPFAYIPPQCWTKTRDAGGAVHNPCFACHVAAPEPNFARDEDLQLSYDFADDEAARNRWTNLFVDRRPAIAATADDEILAYVREDNLHAPDGSLALAQRLAALPSEWDVNGDGSWSGYLPDVWFDFDADGFDRNPQGHRAGWRAYAYKPLPGAFWPTNGSADDVAIRLPPAFRERSDGTADDAIYAVNLAVLESLITQVDVAIPPTDEGPLGVDLDRDGTLGTATRVAFTFDPRNGATMSWVGRARDELAAGRVHLAALLFPEGTEFVHSVRYLDVADGSVEAAPRLKELRYARKLGWRNYTRLMQEAQLEVREAAGNPDAPERFFGDLERGISNGKGWKLQGFIEAADGNLRPQTYEESLTCVGCHGAIGRGTDSIISFPRKVADDPAGAGWYHWSPQRPLGTLADSDGEYARYLRENGAADEFRANAEAWDRFIDADGRLDAAKLAELRRGIGTLTDPSPARALALDKAYLAVVREQSFAKGRVPVLEPLDATVHREVEPATLTGIETAARAF